VISESALGMLSNKPLKNRHLIYCYLEVPKGCGSLRRVVLAFVRLSARRNRLSLCCDYCCLKANMPKALQIRAFSASKPSECPQYDLRPLIQNLPCDSNGPNPRDSSPRILRRRTIAVPALGPSQSQPIAHPKYRYPDSQARRAETYL
jgi:hypothetical protein